MAPASRNMYFTSLHMWITNLQADVPAAALACNLQSETAIYADTCCWGQKCRVLILGPSADAGG